MPIQLSMKFSLLRQRNFRAQLPAGTWRLYNVGSTSMQRHDVASTLYKRHVPAGLFLARTKMQLLVIRDLLTGLSCSAELSMKPVL